ncbi:pilus assembly protein [Silvibacterium dinghuense]|uniref:Pilus assembly protein n=2 Tax=Silvibacterium dinghuense TaxID=1560006 RepID=A0A4Q1SA14_9BACT|nr:pilus assembly protein [Silvibacterium dinghuense]
MSHWCNSLSRNLSAAKRPGYAASQRSLGDCSESGSSLLETALVMPILLLLMAGAIDFGRAYSIAIEVESAAHAGALYGVQNPSDTAGMADAVKADAPNLAALTTTATYGCECFDGSQSSTNCVTVPVSCSGENYVNYAQVSASDTYTPIFPYPGIPSSIVLQKTVEMRSGGD